MYRLIGSLKTRTLRVCWMLEELGLDYELDQVPPRSAPVTEVNPSGKVPVLATEDGTISESVAIMTYLGDRHGGLTHPAGSYARGHQDAMTHLIVDELDAVLWTAARHSFILPEDKRVAEVKPSLKWEFARNIGRINDRLAGAEYLAGDAPTIPDMLLAHCVNWAEGAKFEVDAPHALAHRDRMVARPAYAKVIQLRG